MEHLINTQFWNTCLKVARARPELCAEEVERVAVLIILGLIPLH